MIIRVITVLYMFTYINLRAKLGHLYIINATDDSWTISTYPNIVGEVSKPEKLLSVSYYIYFLIYLTIINNFLIKYLLSYYSQ